MSVIPAAVPALPLSVPEVGNLSYRDESFRYSDFFLILRDLQSAELHSFTRLGRTAPENLRSAAPDFSASVRPMTGLRLYPTMAACAA